MDTSKFINRIKSVAQANNVQNLTVETIIEIAQEQAGEEYQQQIKKSQEELAEDLAKEISDLVNRRYANDLSKPFCKALERQHRTLQQQSSILLFSWIDHLAEMHEDLPGRTDARNEASVKLAYKLKEAYYNTIPEDEKPVWPHFKIHYLPLI